MSPRNPRRLATSTVSTVATVAALEAVFHHPEVRPMELDGDRLRMDPASIPIPPVDQPEGALALAKALAIAIHHPPEDPSARKAFEQGIVDVLVRLSREHPDAALYALDAAREAALRSRSKMADPTGRTNLLIQVVIWAIGDPRFAEVMAYHNREYLQDGPTS